MDQGGTFAGGGPHINALQLVAKLSEHASEGAGALLDRDDGRDDPPQAPSSSRLAVRSGVAVVATVARRRSCPALLSLAYGAVGFAPIGALALTLAGLWSLRVGTLVLVVPAIAAGLVLGIRFPRYGKRAAEGLVAGLLAVLVYDGVRWAFIAAGWWGDFIPTIGGWLDGSGQPNWLLGYGFRWLGDGGGMGLAFVVSARSLAPDFSRRYGLGLGVGYGQAIWLCLLLTLIATPEGQQLLFPLTPVTLVLSGIGHVVYGAVLGGWVTRGRHRVARRHGWADPAHHGWRRELAE